MVHEMHLSGPELRRLVPMRDAIDAMRTAFGGLTRGEMLQPDRLSLADGSQMVMMCRPASGEQGAVVKVVTARPDNPGRGKPLIHAHVLWVDGVTGEFVASIDGEELTALRTGAATGLATDLLSAPKAAVLAVVGAGRQAADQVRAVCTVRPIREIRIASRTQTSADRLVSQLGIEFPHLQISSFASGSAAVTGADIVCSATSAKEPVFSAEKIEPGTHVNAIGAYRPDMCELPPELLRRATLIAVDQLRAALAEAGDLIQAIAAGAIAPECLVEVGSLLDAPIVRSAGPTIFKSVGVAAQDWAVAALAIQRLRTQAMPSTADHSTR